MDVTFAWENAQRLREKQEDGKQIHIRYFGDLDPSGEAIEEATKNKLMLEPYNLKDIDFKRVGVTLPTEAGVQSDCEHRQTDNGQTEKRPNQIRFYEQVRYL